MVNKKRPEMENRRRIIESDGREWVMRKVHKV